MGDYIIDPKTIEEMVNRMNKLGLAVSEISVPTQAVVPKQTITDPNLEALLVEVNKRIDAAYKEGYEVGYQKGHAEGWKDCDNAAEWERELLRDYEVSVEEE